MRQTVTRAIAEWNDLNATAFGVVLLPVLWEISSSPAMGNPQTVLNREIVDDADIVLALLWTRLGTPTGNAASGTVEEIERKAEQGAPVLLYFSDLPAIPSSTDPAQLAAVQQFRAAMTQRALIGQFETMEELFNKVSRDLTRVIRQQQGQLPAPQPAPAAQDNNRGVAVDPVIRALTSYRSNLTASTTTHKIQFDGAVDDEDPELARRIIGRFGQELSDLAGSVAASSPYAAGSELMDRLADLARRANQVGRMEMYLDGGESWRALVAHAQSVLADAAALGTESWVQLLAPREAAPPDPTATAGVSPVRDRHRPGATGR